MLSRLLRSNLRAGTSGLALAVAIATPVMAAEENLGEIIVTARRVEERLQDVPISITVMNPQQLADRNITIANDLATYTPSLSVNERYGPEKQAFSLRGFNQDQSTSPTVGVYFADVVGVRAQGGTTSGNSVGAGAFMDLQNVQVLKGPQGTLFGRNTTGGAILLVPKKPTDKFEGFVEGSTGNYDMRRLQAAVNVPINDKVRIRAAADNMKRDGYMINKSGVGPSAYNDRDYFAGRVSVVVDLAPNLENYTIFHLSDSRTNGYASKLAFCNPAVTTGTAGLTSTAACAQIARQTARGDGPYDIESAVGNPFLKIKQWQVINTTTWTATDTMTLKNIASYGQFTEDAHFDLYSSNFSVPPGGYSLAAVSPLLPPVPAGTAFKYIELDTYPGGLHNSAEKTITEELQLQGHTSDGKLTYVVGGYLEFARPLGLNAGRTGIFLNCTRPQDLACANPTNIGSISESRTSFNFDNHGIFTQATYAFTDRLSATGGFRYTFDKTNAYSIGTRLSFDPANRNPASFIDTASGQRVTRQCTDSFRYGNGFVQDPNSCKTTLVNKSTAPTWVIDLDYKLTSDNMVYAKYARGYRQGGLNFTNPGVESWKPEHMDSYEIGSKNSFHGAISGYLNLAGFYSKLRDQQIFAALISGVPSVAGGAAIVNAGRSRVYGLEADAAFQLTDDLHVDFGYAYLNTKIEALSTGGTSLTGTPFIALIPTVAVGSEFTLAPKHKFTATATYKLPLPESIGKLYLGGTITTVSTQNSNGSVPTFLGVIPNHALINLNLNWENMAGTPISSSFFVTNLTKKVYAVNTGGGYVSSGVGDLLMGEPRMLGVRLKYAFGG